MLRLSGVVHVVGGPASCTAASSLPCWGRKSVFSSTQPVPRARQCPRPARRCRRANSRHASQRSSNLARGGRQGSGPFCQAPQVPKGSAHALGGNGNLALLRSAALHITGPAYDLRCAGPGRAARSGARTRAACAEVVLNKAGSAVPLIPPRQPHVLVRGVGKPSLGIACRGVCCRGRAFGSLLDCTKSSRWKWLVLAVRGSGSFRSR